MSKIGRLLTAMVTPFTDTGSVDYSQARRLAKALVNTGSDGLVIGGTTGEAPSMSEDERLRLFKEVKEEVGDTAAVIAGTTDNNTSRSIEMSIEAQKLGVDSILMTVPAYNKPTQEGLFRHFKSIAEKISISGILYNVPSRTSLNMDAETTLRLAEISNIIGIKEASSNLNQICTIIDQSIEDFRVWSGNDNETFPIMAMGGYGVVSVASNIIGTQIKSMIQFIVDSKIQDASREHRRLLPIFNALFWITSPIAIKYALNKVGIQVGNTRLPLTEMPNEIVNKFNSVLNKYNADITNG